MKYALLFALLAAGCGYLAVVHDPLPLRLVLGATGVSFAGIGLGYGGVGPRIFLKRSNGSLHPLSYLAFLPYHLLNQLTFVLYKVTSDENPFDEIAPNLFLGRRFGMGDGAHASAREWAGVLDLTSEFPEHPRLRAARSYLCIPLLDTFPPSLEQLRAGVEHVSETVGRGPVYVHCALGHGRSATFVAAWLLSTGRARDLDEAHRMIRSKRPGVELHHGQRKSVAAFAATLNTP